MQSKGAVPFIMSSVYVKFKQFNSFFLPCMNEYVTKETNLDQSIILLTF